MPLNNTLFLSLMSLLIKPIAVIFVANGQGLIAVIRPKINTAQTETEVLEYIEPNNSSITKAGQSFL